MERTKVAYQAPVADTQFVLHHVLDIGQYRDLAPFADATPELTEAILSAGGAFAADILAPLNATGDAEGCRWQAGAVHTPAGFREAYAHYTAGGWGGLGFGAELGGQGLPQVLATAFGEYCSSANMAFAMYPGLSHGAIGAILAVGTPEQQQLWLPPMVAGRWTGAMNLTEPQAGTDLSLLRTKAEPQADGSWRIHGNKIFISAGEHDLAENIVHLVLARTPDAPAGVRGLSLFIVPKFLPDGAGGVGAANALSCTGIEHKMGIRASATCQMHFDGATGWLLGEQNYGLKAMFVMMNMARLGVALQGYAQSERAYQAAVAYAQSRLQGRAVPVPANPDQPADPILVHADVRRMLLDQRVFNEGARMLTLWAALQQDLLSHAPDAQTRQDAGDLLSLLTPVLKAHFSEEGFHHCVQAQQVFGGAGYVLETGAEQYVRDSRIALIYEGTNGIQALDLIGRKLAADNSRALKLFQTRLQADILAAQAAEPLVPLCAGLAKAAGHLGQATEWLLQVGAANPVAAAANANAYLRLFALVALGQFWLKAAKAAHTSGAAEFTHKLLLAKYYFDRIAPQSTSLLELVKAPADTLAGFPDSAF